MDGWNTIVSFWDGLFSGAFAVSFREGSNKKVGRLGELLPWLIPSWGGIRPEIGVTSPTLHYHNLWWTTQPFCGIEIRIWKVLVFQPKLSSAVSIILSHCHFMTCMNIYIYIIIYYTHMHCLIQSIHKWQIPAFNSGSSSCAILFLAAILPHLHPCVSTFPIWQCHGSFEFKIKAPFPPKPKRIFT